MHTRGWASCFQEYRVTVCLKLSLVHERALGQTRGAMWNPASWVPNYPGGRVEDHHWEEMKDGILLNSSGELQCSSPRILELDHATCLRKTLQPLTDKAESWGSWL